MNFRKYLGSDPYQDWRTLVIVSCIVVLVFLFFSVSIFRQVNKGEFFMSLKKEEVRVDSIDRTALKNTLDAFANKKLLFQNLRFHPLHFDDPSL